MVYVHKDDVLGWWYGNLAMGCRLCMMGAKVVIFISGICGIDCFYCPISIERRRADAFFVDEERFHNISDILDEIAVIRARGASITGGEPFQRYDLVVSIIRSLKNYLGSSFHIHLYTSGFGATRSSIKYLDKLGLDELRFHIINDSVWKLVEFSVRETSMDIGIEIPVLLDKDKIMKIIEQAEKIGVKFVNLNELEVTESSIDKLRLRGYRISKDSRFVEGSAEIAKKVIEEVYIRGLSISVHFCPVTYKDAIQHKRRLLRKAFICANPNDRVTDDGLLVRGDIEFIPVFGICAKVIKAKGSK